MLFIRTLWRSKYYFLAATALFIVLSGIWKPQYVLATPMQQSFFSYTEMMVPFVVLLPVSFMLYDTYEIELGLINGVSTSKMVFHRFVSTVAATIIPLLVTIVFLTPKRFFAPDSDIFIPLDVPENYKLYLSVSACVTVLFFASLTLLFRVALKNCYAPVGLGILAFSLFESLNTAFNSLSLPLKSALFDPFITKYLIGDKVVNEGFTVPSTGEIIAPIPHLWTYNRLLFVGISLVLLGITYLLLRREKLHESFGD